jgi:hypothetical protein
MVVRRPRKSMEVSSNSIWFNNDIVITLENIFVWYFANRAVISGFLRMVPLEELPMRNK